MRKILPVLLLLLLLACSPKARYVEFKGYAQGGTYTVKANLAGVSVPVETVRDSIEALLKQIDTTLSGYNKASLLSRFNAGEKIPASPMFLEMYALSYGYWMRSEGALDCAAAPLYDAWGFGFKHQSFPSEADVDALRASCGFGLLPAELPVRDGFIDPAEIGSPKLNYNAVAQGYSCDVIARYLYSLGVKDMLVDIGEIWCDGVNPAGEPWSVGVQRPEEGTDGQLDGVWQSGGRPAGVVTSGNYRKFYVKDGHKYAHTVDPRSGYPVEHSLLSATVVSSNSAAEADAVATWCMVIGLQEAQQVLLADPALEGYLIYEEEGQMRQWASPGFTLRQ
ncbi:MAG: FAD:protein FMN transferase [Bacteroidales bacterium]|nr:FAD:protein FMN transferase [Bacteroidales bacterium]